MSQKKKKRKPCPFLWLLGCSLCACGTSRRIKTTGTSGLGLPTSESPSSYNTPIEDSDEMSERWKREKGLDWYREESEKRRPGKGVIPRMASTMKLPPRTVRGKRH